MDINEALQYAKKCKDDGVVSTSAKALIAMHDKLMELRQEIDGGTSLGDLAWKMKDVRSTSTA